LISNNQNINLPKFHLNCHNLSYFCNGIVSDKAKFETDRYMTMIEVKSHSDLIKGLDNNEKTHLLLFKKGSEKSDCAFNNLKNTVDKIKEATVYYADVTQVRDIHSHYGVTTVPTLLTFNKNEVKGVVKGCHGEGYYKTLFEQNAFIAQKGEGKARKNVIVYSTPTCPHCTNLKNYLRKNNIPFRDIDVSKDQNAAQQMVQKSGQQGVPQADINGQIVVGFDKMKIDKLLEIKIN